MMKRLTILVLLIPFMASRCDRKEIPSGCLQGKLIRITCADKVIQVLNDKSLGENNWKNSFAAGNKTYDHVFAVANPCLLPSDLQVGDTIWFNINEAARDTACMVCQLYDAPPHISYGIENISRTPCSR